MKAEMRAHRACCWGAPTWPRPAQRIGTPGSIKSYNFCSLKPPPQGGDVCHSNRGHKELPQTDIGRTDSPVAAPPDLSRHLWNHPLKLLMRSRIRVVTSCPASTGERSENIASKVTVSGLTLPLLACPCVGPTGWPDSLTPPAVSRSAYPASHSQQTASC